MATHHRGSDAERTALNLFIALSRATDTYQRGAFRHAPLPDGLTSTQFGVLEALYHLGPLCQTTVAKKILKTKGNISVVVSHLEGQKLVRRGSLPEDRRQVILELTDDGRALIGRYFPEIAEGFARSAAVLTDEEQKTLTELCKKLGLGVQTTVLGEAR
ncbi:MAG: MarR family transcriptional regulator [Spirochaetales bacterium]|nr:MarR family transcriptional regulator [Spirochaetales bacterium]